MDARFRLSEEQAKALAEAFGTPLYVLSESHLRMRMGEMLRAARAAHRRTRVSLASKANSTLAVLKIAADCGLGIDCASEGELRGAMRAGIEARNCHLHGSNKLRSELEFALQVGAGDIIIDHLDEIILISDLLRGKSTSTKFLIRINPGVDPETHEMIATGQADSKFGLTLSGGAALEGLRLARKLGVPISGVHAHVGSQLENPDCTAQSAAKLAEFGAEFKSLFSEVETIVVGGGAAARYLEQEPEFDFAGWTQLIEQAVRPALDRAAIDPIIGYEPGRALVAEAGVTLYTVGAIKSVSTPGGPKTYASVDGGLSDNPRPALYGARYQVDRVARTARDWEYVTDGPGAAWGSLPGTQIVTVAGRHCETDTLFADIMLPADLAIGDVLQVLTTGAYHASMASNYNRFLRPATVLVRDNGEAKLIVRRETYDELFDREVNL